MLGGVLAAALAGALAACGPAAPAPPPTSEPAPGQSEAGLLGPTLAPTASPTQPVTATPIPTDPAPTRPVPTPLPADQRDYELCVSIASDSNGFGHATFLIPDPDTSPQPTGIIFIKPTWLPLQAHLEALGLDYLPLVDRSLSAGGLTIASANYLDSGQFARLKEDRCKFVVITPFYPDVAVDLSSPERYIEMMLLLVDGLARSSPSSRLLVLNFYQTHRADFTVSNSGRGLRPERIAAFNQALAESCADPAGLGGYPQVMCVDISGWFDDMGTEHVLGEITREEYEASLYRATGYTPTIEDYFARYPDGHLVGDGIHLSLAGRDRLTQRLAQIIFELNAGF